MNPHDELLASLIERADKNPVGMVSELLSDSALMLQLSEMQHYDFPSYARIVAALKERRVGNMPMFEKTIGSLARTMNGVGPMPAPSAAETMAEMAKVIDAGALEFESTALLLVDVVSFVTRYVSFPDPRQVDAVALWIVHTWAIDSFDITPRMSVQAPQRESGKTRLLECCAALVFRPRMWILPSPAVIYRTLDLGPTTLLLDEVDAVFRGRNAEKHDELRAIINEGYSRNGTVPRMVFDPDGKTMRVVEFPVFAPVAMAGIGGVHDTLESRSLVIRLQRQKKRGRARKFRRREVEPRAGGLRDRLTLWYGVHADELREARPVPPDGLSDRAEDIWEPLFSIAELAGPDWRKRADDAARYLAERARDRGDDLSVTLLRDLRSIFDEHPDMARMFTTMLLENLHKMSESPWREWGGRRREPGMNASDLARLLLEFDITPKQLRIGEVTGLRGYERADFEDVWDRYLPEICSGVEPVEGKPPPLSGCVSDGDIQPEEGGPSGSTGSTGLRESGAV